LRDFEDAEIVGGSGKQRLSHRDYQRDLDLALLDLQMPEVNGIDVVKILKPQMPIVTLSPSRRIRGAGF